jgi:hypothetical protein
MTSTYAFATQSDESIEFQQRPGPDTSSIGSVRVVEVAAQQDNQVCLVRRAANSWSGVGTSPSGRSDLTRKQTHQEPDTVESSSTIPVWCVSFSC